MEERERALLSAAASRLGIDLEPSAIDRISRFLDELETWNRRLRLTGERERSTLIRKHVADALACISLIPAGARVADVGSGAGFPGVVLACVRRDISITLIDARERSISFLREVIRTTPLENATALAIRAEAAAEDARTAGRQDVVTCRALRMDLFLRLAKPLLAPGGIAISMQTPRVERSTAEATAAAAGLRLRELRDYELPDGTPRRLVVCV